MQNNEIELKELVSIIWQGKWKIAAIAFVFAIASIFYALSLPNIYKSSALLMPNSQEQSSAGLAGLASQFGGLASLAGINLNGGATDKTGYALEIIKSREFLYKFIQDNDLKTAIMAVQSWDPITHEFIYNPDVYDFRNKKWTRPAEGNKKSEPSLHETYKQFVSENFSVSQDKDTGMVTISILHPSPIFAKDLVSQLILTLNNTVKEQDLNEATKSIRYLESELKNTDKSGMQSMFYQLIEQQQQTLMLTKVRDDYVLKVIDKAIVPEQKFKPKRAIIVILGGLLGVIFASVLVLIFSFKAQRE